MTGFAEITFKGIDCFLIEEEHSFFLKAKDDNNTKIIFKSLSDTDFSIKYKRGNGRKVYAHIEYMTIGPNLTFELFPSFLVEYLDGASFNELRITGDAIDYFFNPAIYFYSQYKASNDEEKLLYTSKTVSIWKASFELQQIIMELSYGNILERGIASDLKLHPRLTVKFSDTFDFEFLNRLYNLVRNFLKTIQYSSRIGELHVELCGTRDGHLSSEGRIYDYKSMNEPFFPSNVNSDCSYLDKYLERIFRILALDGKYSCCHYPSEGVRYRGRHYSAEDFKNIYGAFERECHEASKIYEEVDSTAYNNIREEMCKNLDVIRNMELSDDEAWFYKKALENIKGLGKQRGQVAKIENAYEVLHEAIDGSLEYIFHMPESKVCGHLEKKEIKKLANEITSMRSKLTVSPQT